MTCIPNVTDLLDAPPPQSEVSEAARDLAQALRAAGLSSAAPAPGEEEGKAQVLLRPLDASGAVELARLLHKAMGRAYDVAHELESVARAHGLHGFPSPSVCDGKIRLGTVPLLTADRLASLLGAEPVPEPVDVAEADRAQGHTVVARLRYALARTTEEVVDLRLHTGCERCEGASGIALGDIEVRTAQRLAATLQFGD